MAANRKCLLSLFNLCFNLILLYTCLENDRYRRWYQVGHFSKRKNGSKRQRIMVG